MESASTAQKEVDNVLEWAQQNSVAFDIKNSDILKFQGRFKEIPVEKQLNGTSFEPNQHIRWLGVYIDPKISFKYYVAVLCGKAIRITQQLGR